MKVLLDRVLLTMCRYCWSAEKLITRLLRREDAPPRHLCAEHAEVQLFEERLLLRAVQVDEAVRGRDHQVVLDAEAHEADLAVERLGEVEAVVQPAGLRTVLELEDADGLVGGAREQEPPAGAEREFLLSDEPTTLDISLSWSTSILWSSAGLPSLLTRKRYTVSSQEPARRAVCVSRGYRLVGCQVLHVHV